MTVERYFPFYNREEQRGEMKPAKTGEWVPAAALQAVEADRRHIADLFGKATTAHMQAEKRLAALEKENASLQAKLVVQGQVADRERAEHDNRAAEQLIGLEEALEIEQRDEALRQLAGLREGLAEAGRAIKAWVNDEPFEELHGAGEEEFACDADFLDYIDHILASLNTLTNGEEKGDE